MNDRANVRKNRKVLKKRYPICRHSLKPEGLQRFIDKVKQITQPTKLTPELVHELRYLDRKRYQLMGIYYNSVGAIRGLTPEEKKEAF